MRKEKFYVKLIQEHKLDEAETEEIEIEIDEIEKEIDKLPEYVESKLKHEYYKTNNLYLEMIDELPKNYIRS